MKNTLKNKNKNLKLTTLGFTLIELLAVIVILAIIALIATPIILGIVEDARKDSFMRSVELVINTTDIDIFGKEYNDTYTYTITDGNISNLEVGVKNTEGMNGKIKYDKNGNDTYAIHNGKYCVIKTSGMKKAEITDYVEGECVLGKTTDVKYFTYEEISENEYEYEIVDKDACVEFMIEQWESDEEIAIRDCSGEPNPWEGMTLTEWLASGDASQDDIDDLKQAGAIEEIVTSLDGIEITGYSSEGPKDVVIPEEIDGKQVVSIGVYAFSDKSLTSVVLPETLVKIGHSAFSTNLFTDITIPSNIKIIEDYAFCYTDLNQTSVNNIEEINEYAYCTITDESCFTYEDAEIIKYEIVDKDACVEFHITEWDYDEEYAIMSCNNEPVDGVTLTEKLESGTIAPEAIDELKQTGAIEETITSLEGIEIIGYSCRYTDIVIPSEIDNKKVVSIGAGFHAYDFYDNVETYINKETITPVNYELADMLIEGTLTSVAIPDSVTYIENDVFSNNKIFRLKLSSNLLEIMSGAFVENNISYVAIPNSVTNIGSLAFYSNYLSNLIISDNNQLQTVGKSAFRCMNVPEDSKEYQIIYNINPDAIMCGGS